MNQRFAATCLGLLGICLLAGCSSQPTPTIAPSAESGSTSSEDERIAKAFAELPEADRAVAQKQVICPVGGGKLGTMGAPYKVTIEGQDVFLCCKGCEDALRADPGTHLAKLKDAPSTEPAK